MKKRIFTLMIGAVVALASCSKSDEAPTAPQSGEQLATFNIETPAATRATVTGLTRYIVEAYEGKILTATPTRVEAATGSLTVALKENTEYTFVFWADKGAANANTGYWDAAKLQEVKIAVGKESTVGEAAYCLAVSFNSKDFEANKTVTLKNATAQVNFVEAAGLAAGSSLEVIYPSDGTLNVATGVFAEVTGEITRTYVNSGEVAKDATLATDYILAPKAEKHIVNLKVKLNEETEKTITGVPFQQSYKTNIKGNYSNLSVSSFTFTITADDEWTAPENNVELPAKVGSFYYSDKTFSNTIDANKTCIGIVCWVDPDNATKGKIVSLDEATNTVWSTEEILAAAISVNDGAANTARIFALNSYKVNNSQYPAFTWCATKNTATNPVGINWYIPAELELKNEIHANKAALNTALGSVSGATQLSGYYWSSSEVNVYGTIIAPSALIVNLGSGSSMSQNKKNGDNSVRAVSAF